MRLTSVLSIIFAACLLGCATADICAETASCKEEGYCTGSALWCVVGNDADCSASTNCKGSGLCTKVGDRCLVADEADCAKSKDCAVTGRCGLSTIKVHDEDNELVTVATCAPTKDEHCAAAEGCLANGECSVVHGLAVGGNGGMCGVATSEDCKKSTGCIQGGRCVASTWSDNITDQDTCQPVHLECRAGCSSAADCLKLDVGQCGEFDRPQQCNWACGLDCGHGTVCFVQ